MDSTTVVARGARRGGSQRLESGKWDEEAVVELVGAVAWKPMILFQGAHRREVQRLQHINRP